MNPPMSIDWQAPFERLAREQGLDFDPIEFAIVPASFMLEIAAYGLPVRMPHWSFGVRYLHQLVRHHMGHSHVYEVMFPGSPSHAYLLESNSAAENALVTAHVIGHADFAKRNAVFRHHLGMGGGHILEHSAGHAHQVEAALARYGQQAVEAVLDAALALEAHIDVQAPLDRPSYAAAPPAPSPAVTDYPFWLRYRELVDEPAPRSGRTQATCPPGPEPDLLWFIAHHAPELEDWERDIFLAVREEAHYFYPLHVCNIMNEGWASYWHARLLREADFLPQACYVQALKSHADVVSPYAGTQQLALSVNPYHLGYTLWEHIIARDGLAAARRVCADEDDTGFIRNYLDRELADKLELFVYEIRHDGETRIMDRDLHAIHEAILAPKYHYGAPSVAITCLHDDGRLELTHDARRDGRGLDTPQAEQVMQYVARIWRRPVLLHTVDFRGLAQTVSAAPPAGT